MYDHTLPAIPREIITILKNAKGLTSDEISERARIAHLTATDPVDIMDYLRHLHSMELIEVFTKEGKVDELPRRPRGLFPDEAKIYISSHLESLESALDIDFSLPKTVPVFGAPHASPHWTKVFVLMPFAPKMKPIYEDHIKKMCSRLRLSVNRADNFFSSGQIIADIWSAINHCDVVLADLTGKNGNVFYELGIAHAIGKKAILMSQNINDIPFDLRHLRAIIYGYTPPGMQEFETKLAESLSWVLGQSERNEDIYNKTMKHFSRKRPTTE